MQLLPLCSDGVQTVIGDSMYIVLPIFNHPMDELYLRHSSLPWGDMTWEVIGHYLDYCKPTFEIRL